MTHRITYRTEKTSQRVDDFPEKIIYSSWIHGNSGSGTVS